MDGPPSLCPINPLRRRRHDPQALSSGNETPQVVGALDVVEDDEAVRLLSFLQRSEAALCEGFRRAVIRFPHAHALPELGQPLENAPARLGVDPRDQRPLLLHAAGRDGGGELGLPAAVHSHEHRARRGGGENGAEQILLFAPGDETQCFHWAAAEADAGRPRGNRRMRSVDDLGPVLHVRFDFGNVIVGRLLFGLHAMEDRKGFGVVIQQLLEGLETEPRGSRSQGGELPGDGPYQLVEKGLRLLLHLLPELLAVLTEEILEAVRVLDCGNNRPTIGDDLLKEGRDLGRRAWQQLNIEALLGVPAPGILNRGFQAGGDFRAEGVGGLAARLPQCGDVLPPFVDTLAQCDRAAARGRGHHGRTLDEELGQAETERGQVGTGNHTGSLSQRSRADRRTEAVLTAGGICGNPAPVGVGRPSRP